MDWCVFCTQWCCVLKNCYCYFSCNKCVTFIKQVLCVCDIRSRSKTTPATCQVPDWGTAFVTLYSDCIHWYFSNRSGCWKYIAVMCEHHKMDKLWNVSYFLHQRQICSIHVSLMGKHYAWHVSNSSWCNRIWLQDQSAWIKFSKGMIT